VNPDKFVARGIAAGYRFIATRATRRPPSARQPEHPYRLSLPYIMNCVDVCPKNLNPTKAIKHIKELLVKRAVMIDRVQRERLKWKCRRGLLGAGHRAGALPQAGEPTALSSCSICPQRLWTSLPAAARTTSLT